MEQTLIIIKPDAMQKKLATQILERFENTGLKVKEFSITRLDKDFTKKFYAHLDGKLSVERVKATHDYMTSYKVMLAILEGENAVHRARQLCGPTDPSKAPAGTIRGDFSNDSLEECEKRMDALRNAVHSSGNAEEATKEIEMAKEFLNSP